MNKFWLTILLAGSLFSVAAQTATPLPEGAKALLSAGAEWYAETPSVSRIEIPKGTAADANDFLSKYFRALGLAQPQDLRLARISSSLAKHEYYRYDRLHAGHPVLGSQLVLQLSPGGAPRRLLGHLPAVQQFMAPATAPSLPSSSLVMIAKAQLQSDYPQISQWSVADQGQVWASTGPESDRYILTHAFEISEPAGLRAEMVYLDPQSGKIVFRHQLHCTLHRELYKTNSTRFNLLWQEGDTFPGSIDEDGQEVIRATGEIYNLFYRTFGRKGYDGEDGPMLNIINANLFNCPNAFARGNTINLCTGVVGDDIVGHEWTHNYLTSLNGLLFSYESGSIQEAYADIFGEVVDLLNNRGTDDRDDMRRDSCQDNNLRWRIAEDATAFAPYLRDLWNPGCKDLPDTRDSENYFCKPETPRDGIHINSGVISKAFSLLTDGGILNGDTVRPIGMTKALHLFYHAADKYMSPVTDFPALAQFLRLSSQDLRGIDLPILTLEDLPAMASGQMINAFDSLQLERAISATRMADSTLCDLSPRLAQEPPNLCVSSQLPTLNRLFFQDWESGMDGWTLSEAPENPESWQEKPWTITDILPDNRAGRAIFAASTNEGDCRLTFGNGTTMLTSPVIPLSGAAESFTLSFLHYYSLQENMDGGLLELSLNGEDFFPLPATSFLYNGYNGELMRAGLNDNPLAGQQAFHGADANSSTGSWGESQVDLVAAGAKAGDDIQLRWVLGQDGCEGWLGWYVDNISISFCTEASLPVTYLGFTAEGRKDYIELRWQTAQETDNEGFFVERSQEGQLSFASLGFVAGGTGNYSFDDHTAEDGLTYFYRLRQRDLDGQEEYSSVVSAKLLSAASSLSIYPNPAESALFINSNRELTEISLYDASGRRVRRMQGEGKRAVMDLRSLPAGLYWLQAGESVRRVIKRQ
ncbi:M4 family metallopeptidase [Neolewinella agarilytica]|uniref:Por secretion system C-terminal sorting domain-containing protein n=1 Tax=Neolewinella agarilytica TaxID=478744 RepID=A0A1H9J1E9_9BACT|nr:M4 family metallopeptidase [Neolewinella agarilytica]SEQ80616.1 Por secretion system C-terminal sorting domain-containing protein [Neolewinella agarilytica]